MDTGDTLSIEEFWRWLVEHPNCILRVGSADVSLFDLDELHWGFEEDGDGNRIVQLLRGKSLVGELVLDVRDARYVQWMPDQESSDRGYYLFEIVAGPKEEAYAVYHFLMAHGLDHQEMSHPVNRLKH